MGALLLPLLLLLQAAWVLAPGLAVASWLCRKKYIPPAYVVIIAGVVGALLAYGAFWAYLGDQHGGQLYGWLVADAGVFGLVWALRQPAYRALLRTVDVIIPLVLLLLGTLLYSSMTFACQTSRTVTQPDQFCYTHNITFDNIIPQLFANNVYNGQPKLLIGDWRGSDRPPLQSGAVLLESPLTEHQGTQQIFRYQLLGTLLQMIWIPAVWALCRSLRLHRARSALVVAFCLASGFFLFNSVFVWPKLLAGSLVIAGFGLLFCTKPHVVRWLLAALAISCGYVTHSGVLFTLIPMFCLLCLPRFWPGYRIALPAALLGLLLIAPWAYYQTYYDPPGNRLSKWHLGGSLQIDQRSLPQTLVDSYRDTPAATIAENKAENAGTIFGRIPLGSHIYGDGTLASLRSVEFRSVLVALGMLNAGWLLLAASKHYWQRLRHSDIALQHLGLVWLTAGGALLAWILLMFGPGTTIIHQGSYATILLLFVGLGAIVSTFPRRIVRWLLAAQATYFILVWIVNVWAGHHVQYSYVLWAIAALCGIAVCLRQTSATGEIHAASD